MTETSTTADDLLYDPSSRELAQDPWPTFKRLRDEAPLYHRDDQDFYALSRFEDVERAHVDRETFISGRGGTLGILRADFDIPKGTIIFEDPPTHTIHRSLLSRMFTPRRVAGLEQEIRDLCAGLLDPCVEQGRFDWVADLGNVMPTMVVGMLIGIPEEDRTAVRDFYDRQRTEHIDGQHALGGEIFSDYIDWRVEHPSDDIMTQLLNVEFEDETGATRRLTREELLAYVNIVAAAGNDTTRRLIGWTGKLLGQHPDQRRMVTQDRDLVTSTVEEVLRFEPPPLQSCRYVARDTEWYGEIVPEGSFMALLIASANRDERRIEDPDTFDVTRKPGQMFTFGFGGHYCIGQALARLQGRIALEEVLDRFPEWEIDWEGAEFAFDGDLRGWDRMPAVVP
jgi:cytochrome P450